MIMGEADFSWILVMTFENDAKMKKWDYNDRWNMWTVEYFVELSSLEWCKHDVNEHGAKLMTHEYYCHDFPIIMVINGLYPDRNQNSDDDDVMFWSVNVGWPHMEPVINRGLLWPAPAST